MAKATNNTTTQPVQGETLYTLGKPPRGLRDNTKNGKGGTAGTYAACAAALGDAPLTLAALRKVCVANGDPGFAAYAVRNQWFAPVQADAPKA